MDDTHVVFFDWETARQLISNSGFKSARLFGISIPENFDWPYIRTNISEFWRHWHMSLYKWLVDYVFIPLGGSRGTTIRVSSNVMVVMLVSGLWHGAGLNFIAWERGTEAFW